MSRSPSVSLRRVKLKQPEPINAEACRLGHGNSTTLPPYSDAEQVGRYIYVVGKLGNTVVNGFHWSVVAVLDIPTKSWRWIYGPGAFLQGSKIFLFEDALYAFGHRDWKDGVSKDLSVFDLILGEWSFANSTGPRSDHRSYFSGHFLEDRSQFLVFGGISGGVRSDVYLVQMPHCRWIQPVVKGRPPAGRWQHGSCVHNGVFYCYGGWKAYGRHKDGLFLLHIGPQNLVTWSKPNLATESCMRLSSFSFVPFCGRLLLCGGYGPTGFHQVSMYEPATGELSVLRNNPQDEQFGHGAVVLPIESGSALLILGGRGELDYYLSLTLNG